MAITMADPYYESLKRTAKCPICGKRFVPAAQMGKRARSRR